MKRFATTIAAVSLSAYAGFGPAQGHAQSVSENAPVVRPAALPAAGTPANAAPVALDPAMQRLFLALAMSTLSNFANSAARGSLDGFDPGPAIESALHGALSSRDLNAVIERLVEQSGAGAEGAAASPEMRAMLKAALRGVVAMARSEIAREFSGTVSAQGAFGAPLFPSVPAAPSMIP